MGTSAVQTEMNPHIRREDALADPMLWAVKYRVHPKDDKKPFAFEREIKVNNLGAKIIVPLRYQHEIYNALKRLPNLYMAIEKARQMRMSEWLVNSVYYICDTHIGVTILYILHDEKNGVKFVKKRIDPTIDDSPYLCKLISDVKQAQNVRIGRRKIPDSLALKRFGRCWFYMLHSTSDSASRSPDADIAIFDEYDAHNKTNETSFRKSCGDSDIKAFIYVSTPTLPDYGIDLKYKSTSMGQWTINCANCLQDFTMDSVYFFGDGIKVLEAPRWTDGAVRIFVCPHCGEEIAPADKQIRGRYVHAVPELIKENRLGFKFSNLILPNITADAAWSEYRECLMDPKGGGRKLYLNENLGEATMDEEVGARYSRDVMLECCDENWGWVESGRNTIMGVVPRHAMIK